MTGMVLAPLCVPVELQRPNSRGRGPSGLRYFRLAVGLEAGGDGLRLRSPVPDELRDGPLRARFHLPPPTESTAKLLGVAWEGEITVAAAAADVVVDAGTEHERREARLLVFHRVAPATRERLQLYASLRLEQG